MPNTGTVKVIESALVVLKEGAYAPMPTKVWSGLRC